MEEEANNGTELFRVKPNADLPSHDREAEVTKFLDAVFPVVANNRNAVAALVPWLCDVLLSQESLKAYSSDLNQFARRMQRQDVGALDVNADHIKLYKASLVQSKARPGSIARKLTVLRGTYQQLAIKELVRWEVAHDIFLVGRIRHTGG